jgi:aminopeptidase N
MATAAQIAVHCPIARVMVATMHPVATIHRSRRHDARARGGSAGVSGSASTGEHASMRSPLRLIAVLGAAWLAGCGGDSGTPPDGGRVLDGGSARDAGPMPHDDGGRGTDGGPMISDGGCAIGTCPPVADLSRDVVESRLALDLSTHRGTIDLTVAGSITSAGVSFEIGDLTITSVSALAEDDVVPLVYTATAGQLDIGVAPGIDPIAIRVEYAFVDHDALEGWVAARGVSFLWPTFCGNLFPCHSSPADGSTFALTVTGAPAGSTVVYPEAIPGSAPSYMPAIAVGDYTYERIGVTPAGTEVGFWYLPGEAETMRAGTRDLDDTFALYETTLGAYTFGDRVGSVSAPWGPAAYGGMEHHPYWHVATGALGDAEVHAHEAAHGWFGNGVRIACWEDFVLSEGVTSYLAARALEHAGGAEAGTAVWAAYRTRLESAVASGDTIALPDATCDEIDIAASPLWSNIPYMKGAFFLRAVESAVGRSALDAALRAFYTEHVGRAARMQDLLDTIETETGLDPGALADDWLRSLGIPE